MGTRLDDVHAPGAHCGSTSLRNLADHFGWGYDEPTCLGLAAGLGFAYFELPVSPYRGFFGRPLWLETAFFEHLGIEHDHREGEDWETVWDRITETIDDGDPVMVFADIYYLDYYESDTHFSPHSLLVVGYDEDDDVAILGDSEFPLPQELPTDRLHEAMTTDHVMPLRNRHLEVTDPAPTVDTETAVRTAIDETASYMLDPETATRSLGPGTHGVDGIRDLAAGLPEWTALEDPHWSVRFAYQNIERRGTGGGAFRHLYADFLESAVDHVAALGPIAADMHDIADRWTGVAETLYEASEVETTAEMTDPLAAAATELESIAEAEADCYERLAARI